MAELFSLHIHVVSSVARFTEQTWTTVRAAPSQSTSASVPAAFQHGNGSGMSERACGLERAPFGPAASPTTFNCMLVCIRAWGGSQGLPSPPFSHPASSRAGRCASAAWGFWLVFALGLPTELGVKTVMQIRTAVVKCYAHTPCRGRTG